MVTGMTVREINQTGVEWSGVVAQVSHSMVGLRERQIVSSRFGVPYLRIAFSHNNHVGRKSGEAGTVAPS